MESCGFPLVNSPRAKGQVGKVNDIELKTNGVGGMVIVQCERDENASSYKARVSTDQQNWLWVNASPNRTVKVHNVPVGVPIYVQMQLEKSEFYSLLWILGSGYKREGVLDDVHVGESGDERV